MTRVTVGIGMSSGPPLSRARWFIRAARAMRLDSVWAVDHWLGWFPIELWDEDFTWVAKSGSTPHRYFDWATLLGWAAERTGSLRLGVGVTDATRHHPVKLAQTAMTLSHLARRPPILGLGAGEAENIVPYGLEFDTPVGRLDEALQIIRLCVSARGPFDFEGRHFTLRQAMMDLAPKPGNEPELWLAAHGPRMLGLAGRYADGWYPAIPMTPAEYAANLDTIRTAAADAGRDPAAITPGQSTFFAVGRSHQEAEELLHSAPMRFFALLTPHTFWERFGHAHPLGEGFRGMVDFVPQHYPVEEIRAAMARVPSDVLGEFVVWGTVDEVIEKLRTLVEAGLRHVTLTPVSAMVSRTLARHAVRSIRSIARALHTM